MLLCNSLAVALVIVGYQQAMEILIGGFPAGAAELSGFYRELFAVGHEYEPLKPAGVCGTGGALVVIRRCGR